MKRLAAAGFVLSLIVTGAMANENTNGVTVTAAGAKPSAPGPAANFTGAVRIDAPFQGAAPARVGGATVTFEPGAHTAWHTHPLGQTLILTAGSGLVQEWGGPVRQIRPGDTVWIAPGVKHWHGAAPTVGMSHIAIAEALDGKAVTWQEKLSDAQYKSPVQP